MIKKIENCIYCGEKMESKTAKKKFCSAKCRVYYKRELERGTLMLPKVGDEFSGADVIKRKQHNHSLTVTVRPKFTPLPPSTPPPARSAEELDIEVQIAAIRAEKMPEWRNTAQGRKSWVFDQNKRIVELKAKLKH